MLKDTNPSKLSKRQKGAAKEQGDAKYSLDEISFESIWENTWAGIYVIQNGRFQAVNPVTILFTGYDREALIGRKVESIIHPEDVDDVRTKARDMLLGRREDPYLFRIFSKNKEIRWVLENVTSILFKGKPAILGNAMDLTAVKKMEASLKSSEALYRTIFETTGSATVIVEDDMTISLMNSEFERLTGYRKEEWEGRRKWTEYIAKGDLLRMKKYHRLRRVEPTSAPSNYEFSLIDSSGRTRHHLITISMIPGTKTSVASHIDITDWKTAQNRLQESENLYRAIFETTGTATVIMEEDMTISLMNSEFERLTGYSKEDWEGKRKWTEYMAKEDHPSMIQYHHLRRIDPNAPPKSYESRLIDSQGRVRHIILTVGMIPGTKKSVASFMDITDWKDAERNLKNREKDLEIKSRNLSELNTALRVLLKQREDDREEFEEKVLSNVREFVLPYIETIKKSKLQEKDMAYVGILESNLQDIISPFSRKLSSKYMRLTPKEVQIAYLIKEGKTSKEIAEIMNVSKSAIDIHRYRLRNKLGLNNQKANLRTHLTNIA